MVVGVLVPLGLYFLPRPLNPHVLEAGAYFAPLATILLLSFDEYHRRAGTASSQTRPRAFFTLAYFVAVGVWFFVLYKVKQVVPAAWPAG